MEDMLKRVDELIEKANNIPEYVKLIVKAIAKGYIRESNGKIPIEGIINVCNAQFIKIEENDKIFSGEEKIFGSTETYYDKNCNVFHKMSYINTENYIKLITILTHELGHVITEAKPNQITQDGVYPLAKRTTAFYFNCRHENDELVADGWYGFRMADGFLESICTKIFLSPEFRKELSELGYDLKDYVYKDIRLFRSRIYDEYKACFELFDYIMDGALFDFSCSSFKTNEELLNYINKYQLNIIFDYLDQSNDALWNLKKYEDKQWDKQYDKSMKEYLEHKNMALSLSAVLLDSYGKSLEDKEYQRLYEIYSSILTKQKHLPMLDKYIENITEKPKLS